MSAVARVRRREAKQAVARVESILARLAKLSQDPVIE
jgi:hypothetical protein